MPGGGDAAAVIGAVLSTLILASFVWLAARFYREHQYDLDGLGDRWRGLLYGAIALVIFAMAARQRLLDTSAGAIVWVAPASPGPPTRATASGATGASTRRARASRALPPQLRDDPGPSRHPATVTLRACPARPHPPAAERAPRAARTVRRRSSSSPLLPLLALLALGAWQAVLAGQAAWLAAGAARASARAAAVGDDPAAAARRSLPPALERGLRVTTRPPAPRSRSASRSPASSSGAALATIRSSAGFPEQRS